MGKRKKNRQLPDCTAHWGKKQVAGKIEQGRWDGKKCLVWHFCVSEALALICAVSRETYITK